MREDDVFSDADEIIDPRVPFKDRPFYRRVVDFDALLRRGRGITCSSVARKWDTSSKTVQRFIEQMKLDFDAPIVYDRAKGTYRYSDPSYRLPWIPVDGKDLFSIGVAMKVMQIYDGTPAARDMRVVFERLAELMPAEVRVRPTSLVERLYVQPFPLRAVTPEIWDSVAAALRDHLALEIRYRKLDGSESLREIEPYCLVLATGTWIVVARDPNDALVKNFYLSRIRAARDTGRRYAIPRDFSPERHFGESLGIFTGKETFRFRVRFEKEIASWVEEVQWHPKQKLTKGPVGTVELELPTASMWEARRFVLSFGKTARAV
jgi:proteasome accessory factor B